MVDSSRTTTGDSAPSSATERTERPNLKTALYHLAVACGHGVISQLPDDVHHVIDNFMGDPINACKTYSSTLMTKLKSIKADDVKAFANWSYLQVSMIISKLPVREAIRLVQNKSHELMNIFIPKAQNALKNAELMCRKQIDQYCERRRQQTQHEKRL